MVDYYEIIISSLEWTAAVLFRPFHLKKWFLLALLALVTGVASCQLNINIPTPPKNPSVQPAGESTATAGPQASAVPAGNAALSSTEQDSAAQTPQPAAEHPFPPALKAVLISAAAILVLVILAGMIIWAWLIARCTFVFLADIVRNDASIAGPFGAYKREGNSLFRAGLVFTAVFFAACALTAGGCLLILWRMGVFAAAPSVGWLKIALVCLPFVLLVLIEAVAALVFWTMINDLVVVIMAADRCGFLQGWKTLTAIFADKRVQLVRYILFKFAVMICQTGIIAGMLVFPMLAMVLVWGPAFLLAGVMPPWAAIVLFLILIPAAVPVLIALTGVFICLQLPLAVFTRTASIKFMARIKPEYNLFCRVREEYAGT